MTTRHSASEFWVDGQPADSVPITDRGFQYGDGIFETVRVINGDMPLFPFHWQRLLFSCRRLFLPLNPEQLHGQIACFVNGRGSGTLKIMVTRGCGGRGYGPGDACGRTVLGWFPPRPLPDQRSQSGIMVMLCRSRLGHTPALAGLKHMNRLEQVLARAEVGHRFGEGLMLDINDRVIEGTMSNLFLVESGEVVTPDLSMCGVEGVLRSWLLNSSFYAEGASIADVSRERLYDADEVFIGNSVMGVVPIIGCEHRRWRPGPVTSRVQQEFFQLFYVDTNN